MPHQLTPAEYGYDATKGPPTSRESEEYLRRLLLVSLANAERIPFTSYADLQAQFDVCKQKTLALYTEPVYFSTKFFMGVLAIHYLQKGHKL
jgi:hypothetical protein